ncbi:hypothetical protein [Nonomuraea sp. NPDC050786]|uniref:hypothetical protein n=1 Tax=Nonomuraea sp. NPDC050786 TaxID=3154840 RepID=UPI0033DBBDF7
MTPTAPGAGSLTRTVLNSADALAKFSRQGLSQALPEGRLRELFRLEYVWQSAGVPSRYVLVLDRRGVLGVLPVYPALGRHYAGWTPQEALGAAGPAADWQRGVLIGSDGLAANTMAIRPDVPKVASILFKAACGLAAEYKPDFVCLPRAVGWQAEAAAYAPPAAYAEDSEAVLELTAGSFDRYVMTLPTARRAHVRRERRLFLESPIEVREELLDRPLVRRLAPLLHQVNAKYGVSTNPMNEWRFLDAIRHTMGDTVRALVAYLGTAPIAFNALWEAGIEWRSRCWGCDYDRPEIREYAVYFNILIHEAALRAAAGGGTALWVGSGSATAKQRRGARLRPVRTLAWAATPAAR